MRASRRAGSIRRCARRVLRASDADGFARARRLDAGLADAAAAAARAIGPRAADRIVATRPASCARASAGAARWTRATSSRCSRRAATSSTRSAPRPTRCAAASAATRSRYVVNRNINYTNICYLPLPVLRVLQRQARREPARAGLRPRRSTRSRAACAKPGSAARPKSACRAASIRDYTGETYLAILRAVKAAVPRHARPRVLAARSVAGRADARAADRRLPRPAEGRRARHAAGHRGGNPRRRGARGASARTSSRPSEWLEVIETAHRVGLAHHGDHHVRPRRAAASTGRAICCASATCRSAPAASPSSCRCRSCTWRRRSICKGRARRARPSARRC